jgi:hypothetical protein
MRLIDDLTDAGYVLLLEHEEIVARYTGPGQPDPATVRPLLEELRRRKAEAVAYLRQHPLTAPGQHQGTGSSTDTLTREERLALAKRLYDRAHDEIAKEWQSGCMSFTERYNPELMNEIERAEAAADAAWLELESEDGGDIEAFRQALTAWRDLNLQAAKGYSKFINHRPPGPVSHEWLCYAAWAASGKRPAGFPPEGGGAL